MIRTTTIILGAAVVAIGLSACDPMFKMKGTTVAAVAGAATPAVLSADQVATLARTCQAAAPALSIAAAPSMPAEVRETAVYPLAYCSELSKGLLPATTDGNTPSWLPGTLSALSTAAKIAGVVLPLLL